MTPYLLVAQAAAFAAFLTLYSGFGLGTLLLPVFALFFPVELAVAATAVVHGANNVLKVALVGRFADWLTVVRFGVPAILAAIAGATLLAVFAGFDPLTEYSLFGRQAVVTPIKLVMGVLMFGFALFELLPAFRNIRFQREHLVIGGLLSGFFGGLSGHQGALRSAFLVKSGLDTESFVGTSSVIGLMVDAVRIMIYLVVLSLAGAALRLPPESWPLIAIGCLAAFSGVLIGRRFLHKVRITSIQLLTGVMLLLIAVLLGSGMI